MFIYLDKEKAKQGISLVLGVSDERVEKYKEYYGQNSVEFIGDDVPHYISYDDAHNTIREATKDERYKQGNLTLQNYEVIIDGEIVEIDVDNEKVVNGILVEKTRQEKINSGYITIKSEMNFARGIRTGYLLALDKADKNYLMGRLRLTNDELLEHTIFYNNLLDITKNYTDLSVPIMDRMPKVPTKIKQYLK